MILIHNFHNLVILFEGFQTLFFYLFTSIKKSSSIILVYKRLFRKSSNNFLEKLFNVINNLKNFLKTWQFAYLYFSWSFKSILYFLHLLWYKLFHYLFLTSLFFSFRSPALKYLINGIVFFLFVFILILY